MTVISLCLRPRGHKEIPLQLCQQFNGAFIDGSFHPAARVNPGVAISLRRGGLIAPALFDADRRHLPELMRDLSELVGRARAGLLRSSELSESTITVTQLGDQGVKSVFGVIYPPQVALVGFGRVTVGRRRQGRGAPRADGQSCGRSSGFRRSSWRAVCRRVAGSDAAAGSTGRGPAGRDEMNVPDVKVGILSVLASVVPELEAGLLVPDRPLRRPVDLDSTDWLNFLVGLHGKFGVDIPEADYAHLVTLDDIERYLVTRMNRPQN